MSLEDAVHRLANAIGMHEDAAVKEIIRQRDEANKSLAAMTNNRDYFRGAYERYSARLLSERRKTAALRGVITRMKARAK